MNKKAQKNVVLIKSHMEEHSLTHKGNMQQVGNVASFIRGTPARLSLFDVKMGRDSALCQIQCQDQFCRLNLFALLNLAAYYCCQPLALSVIELRLLI